MVDSTCEVSVSATSSRFDAGWVTDPDGARWEVYTVVGDSDVGTPGEQTAVALGSRPA